MREHRIGTIYNRSEFFLVIFGHFLPVKSIGNILFSFFVNQSYSYAIFSDIMNDITKFSRVFEFFGELCLLFGSNH